MTRILSTCFVVGLASTGAAMPLPNATQGSAVCIDPRDALRERSAVRLRVLCVPQAGMGAWAYHGWQKHMPDGAR